MNFWGIPHFSHTPYIDGPVSRVHIPHPYGMAGVTPLSTTHPPHLTPTTSTGGLLDIYIYISLHMHIDTHTHILSYLYRDHHHLGVRGGPPNSGPFTYVYIYIYKQHVGVTIYFPTCYVLLLRDPCWGDHHFDPT